MPRAKKYFINPKVQDFLEKADIVVWDLNGLMIDDEPLQRVAHNAGIVAYYKAKRPNETPPQISDEDWGKVCVGRHPQDWLPVVTGRPLDEGETEAVKRVKDAVFFKLVGDRIHGIARPGVLELVRYLCQERVPIALATSSSAAFVKKTLGKEGLNVLSCFDFRLCAEQVKKKKPDPEIYNRVKEYFGEDLRYLVIEDAESGIIAAKEAGMECIAVPNRYTNSKDLSRADAIVDTLCSNAAILMPVLPLRAARRGAEDACKR